MGSWKAEPETVRAECETDCRLHHRNQEAEAAERKTRQTRQRHRKSSGIRLNRETLRNQRPRRRLPSATRSRNIPAHVGPETRRTKEDRRSVQDGGLLIDLATGAASSLPRIAGRSTGGSGGGVSQKGFAGDSSANRITTRLIKMSNDAIIFYDNYEAPLPAGSIIASFCNRP